MAEKKKKIPTQKELDCLDRGRKNPKRREAISKSLINNDRRTIIKDPDIRKIAYQAYVDWISAGNFKKTFTFEHEELLATYKTIEGYMERYPSEFPPLKREIAEAKCLQKWVDDGKEMMKPQEGQRVVPAIYNILMRNIHGWDKEQVQTSLYQDAIKDDLDELHNKRPSPTEVRKK